MQDNKSHALGKKASVQKGTKPKRFELLSLKTKWLGTPPDNIAAVLNRKLNSVTMHFDVRGLEDSIKAKKGARR